MNSNQNGAEIACSKSVILVVLLTASIVSISGVFMGMRHSPKDEQGYKPWLNQPNGHASDDHHVHVAPRYADIPESDWKVDSHWVSHLNTLPKASDEQVELPVMSAAERGEVIAHRAERRAYDGAPPVIPHAIQSIEVQSCVACHSADANVLIAGKETPKMSHPMLANCTQCHVPSEGENFLKGNEIAGLNVESLFVGASSPGKGDKAYDGAPPVVPHRLNMRQNCMACHGNGMANAVSTSHPQRKNCLQCHAPNATFDNRERYNLNDFKKDK